MVVISPYETQELLNEIKTSGKTNLHLYWPRPTQDFRDLDKLNLYTVPSSAKSNLTPLPLRTQALLNFFAGQLYLSSMEECCATSCGYPINQLEWAR